MAGQDAPVLAKGSSTSSCPPPGPQSACAPPGHCLPGPLRPYEVGDSVPRGDREKVAALSQARPEAPPTATCLRCFREERSRVTQRHHLTVATELWAMTRRAAPAPGTLWMATVLTRHPAREIQVTEFPLLAVLRHVCPRRTCMRAQVAEMTHLASSDLLPRHREA